MWYYVNRGGYTTKILEQLLNLYSYSITNTTRITHLKGVCS